MSSQPPATTLSFAHDILQATDGDFATSAEPDYTLVLAIVDHVVAVQSRMQFEEVADLLAWRLRKASSSRTVRLTIALLDALAKNAGLPFLRVMCSSANLLEALAERARVGIRAIAVEDVLAYEQLLAVVQSLGEDMLTVSTREPALRGIVNLYHTLKQQHHRFGVQLDETRPPVLTPPPHIDQQDASRRTSSAAPTAVVLPADLVALATRVATLERALGECGGARAVFAANRAAVVVTAGLRVAGDALAERIEAALSAEDPPPFLEPALQLNDRLRAVVAAAENVLAGRRVDVTRFASQQATLSAEHATAPVLTATLQGDVRSAGRQGVPAAARATAPPPVAVDDLLSISSAVNLHGTTHDKHTALPTSQEAAAPGVVVPRLRPPRAAGTTMVMPSVSQSAAQPDYMPARPPGVLTTSTQAAHSSSISRDQGSRSIDAFGDLFGTASTASTELAVGASVSNPNSVNSGAANADPFSYFSTTSVDLPKDSATLPPQSATSLPLQRHGVPPSMHADSLANFIAIVPLVEQHQQGSSPHVVATDANILAGIDGIDGFFDSGTHAVAAPETKSALSQAVGSNGELGGLDFDNITYDQHLRVAPLHGTPSPQAATQLVNQGLLNAPAKPDSPSPATMTKVAAATARVGVKPGLLAPPRRK